ncbi:MAG: histidine phosphatase family protein [Muribaculaceae bacterium]|nr:histidine phosphatase family protein [Muribaculaceae bacterium]
MTALLLCRAWGYKVLPAQYDGTMSLYDFDAVDSRPEIPDSLTPVYISYVARHGARYLSSEKKVTAIEKVLVGSKTRKHLTASGVRFLKLLSDVREITGSRWGALDAIGMDEQCRLARGMFDMWPEILRAGRIDARSTYVPRVVMSMYMFTHTLSQLSDSLEIYTDEGRQNDALLRFFDTDAEYVRYLDKGDWRNAYDEFMMSHTPVQPALRLVGSDSGMSDDDLRRLTMDMYGVLQGMRASGMPAPTTEWMSVKEYAACREVANLKHYLQRVDNRFSDIAARSAIPLLSSILKNADDALDSIISAKADTSCKMNTRRGDLYFGHAETLMPLLSLMGLPGCSPCYENCFRSLSVSPDYENLTMLWDDTAVSPLAANLEIVFMLSDTWRIYVLMRLNGRNLELTDGEGYIYPWHSLKQRWTLL